MADVEKKKRLFIGEVVSDKMDKTLVVRVERTYRHPSYKKVMRAFKQYKVHDERNEGKVGDVVEFYEGSPVSKTKFMYLNRLVQSK